MKRSTLQQHKEAKMCEKNIITLETKSAMSIPQSTKQATLAKTQNNTRKINQHYTNCGMINHIMETCKKKKEHTTMATTKAKQLSQKTQKTFSYACHISCLNGHKMIDCPKFAEMQKTFHEEFVTVVKVQLVIETQTIIANMNVVEVNVTTRSKVTQEHVFKDREPRKAKSVVN